MINSRTAPSKKRISKASAVVKAKIAGTSTRFGQDFCCPLRELLDTKVCINGELPLCSCTEITESLQYKLEDIFSLDASSV